MLTAQGLGELRLRYDDEGPIIIGPIINALDSPSCGRCAGFADLSSCRPQPAVVHEGSRSQLQRL